MSSVSGPLLRYYGGKWRLAPWIISHFPPHDIYVEPFCGAASVLLRKPRSKHELLFDSSREIICLLQAVKNRDSREKVAAEFIKAAMECVGRGT